METASHQRLALQDAMVFLGAIASGTEKAIGESANSISYLAGVNLGKKLSEGIPHTHDIQQALELTREVLEKNDYLWLFEPFKTHDQENLVQETEDGTQVMLVFRDCMIRQSLFRFGHIQKGSLCNMMYGFFAGALQNIMGLDSTLEIVHAGENACYKKLTVRRAP
jgi:predicted hydrocarbon binding protein